MYLTLLLEGTNYWCLGVIAVSYTHLDVYKRQAPRAHAPFAPLLARIHTIDCDRYRRCCNRTAEEPPKIPPPQKQKSQVTITFL